MATTGFAVQARPSAATAGENFATLKTLAGVWRATRPSGRTVDLTYHLTAGGTVLVETWTLSPTRESMTVFHLDGRDLLATHYCPIGNQPRLRLVDAGARRMRFAFKDATNLKPRESHQHAFSLDLTTPDRIVRDETYREGRVSEEERLVFTRVPAG